jgi:hypothetical protein
VLGEACLTKWLSGGKVAHPFTAAMLTVVRITRLLGESFKIHAQALSGYDDALASGASTPPVALSGPEVFVAGAHEGF